MKPTLPFAQYDKEFADWWKSVYREVPQAFQIRYAEALDRSSDELARQIDEAILRDLQNGSDRTRYKTTLCVESKRKDPAISENPQKFAVQKDTKND